MENFEQFRKKVENCCSLLTMEKNDSFCSEKEILTEYTETWTLFHTILSHLPGINSLRQDVNISSMDEENGSGECTDGFGKIATEIVNSVKSSSAQKNLKFQKNIRQLFWIATSMVPDNDSFSLSKLNGKCITKNSTFPITAMVWESLAILIEKCGGQWLLLSDEKGIDEKIMPNMKNLKEKCDFGVGRLYCGIVQCCANEMRVQLGYFATLLTSVQKPLANTTNDHEKQRNLWIGRVSITCSCGRTMVAVTSLMIDLADILDDDNIDEDDENNRWTLLPFDAILYLKKSLEDAHDSIIQYLAMPPVAIKQADPNECPSLQFRNSSNDELHLKLCYTGIRCLGAWLSEMDISEITSPAPIVVGNAVRNAVALFRVETSKNVDTSMGVLLEKAKIKRTTTQLRFIDIMPLLVKIAENRKDPNHQKLKLGQNDFMQFAKSVHQFMTAIIKGTYQQGTTKVDTLSSDESQFLLLPFLAWTFLFFQHFDLDIVSCARTEGDEEFNSLFSLPGTILHSLQILHSHIILSPSLLTSLLRKGQASQAKIDKDDDETAFTFAVIKTLTYGVQCWFKFREKQPKLRMDLVEEESASILLKRIHQTLEGFCTEWISLDDLIPSEIKDTLVYTLNCYN